MVATGKIMKGSALGFAVLVPLLLGARYAADGSESDGCSGMGADPALSQSDRAAALAWAKASFEPTAQCLVASQTSTTARLDRTAAAKCKSASDTIASQSQPASVDGELRDAIAVASTMCSASLADQGRMIARNAAVGFRRKNEAHLRICVSLINRIARRSGEDLIAGSCQS